MEQLVLINQNEQPTEDIIFSHIGRTKKHWKLLFELIDQNYPELNQEWRYYKDGKSWLMKVTKKKNTIFWLSVIKKKFKITFYFTDKAEELINSSKISSELKKQFEGAKYYNKIRGLTITFSKLADIDYAKILIDIKLNLK